MKVTPLPVFAKANEMKKALAGQFQPNKNKAPVSPGFDRVSLNASPDRSFD